MLETETGLELTADRGSCRVPYRPRVWSERETISDQGQETTSRTKKGRIERKGASSERIRPEIANLGAMSDSDTDATPERMREPASVVRFRRAAGFTGLQVVGIVVLAVGLTAGLTWWIGRTYLWPTEFEPVTLSASEQVRLDSKLRALGIDPSASGAVSHPTSPPAVSARRQAPARDETPSGWLHPEPYSENGAKREIGLTERELNALLAHDPDLAERLAIDLSDDLASARLLIPLDPDFPILGGRTLRIAAGLGLSYAEGRPVVILRGVSLMGVPIPNAWLGNLKNVDLVQEFGGSEGFWKTLADGIEYARIRDGELKIQLRE